MTTCDCAQLDDYYPEIVAKTNHFRKGAPRSFTLANARAAFVRSANSDTNQLDLWIVENLDSTPNERLVIRAADLLQDSENLSAAERARRERLREAGAGITSYSSDELLTIAVFSLSGALWVADLNSGTCNQLPGYDSVVDPRLNRSGDSVAFTSGADFVVYNLASDTEIFRLKAESETVSYGLADFVASEELSRYRGHWWSPDGGHLLVQRTDEAPVKIRYIADPTYPDQSGRPHRYPMAGEANPMVQLFLVDLEESSSKQIVWDVNQFEYLADVDWKQASPLITLLSRDQRIRSINTLDAGELKELLRQSDLAWLDCGTGTPQWQESKLVTVVENPSHRQLLVDGAIVDLGGRHLDSVLSVSVNRIVVTAYNKPWELEVFEISRDSVTSLSDPHGFAMAIADDEYAIVIQHDLVNELPRYLVKRGNETIHEIATHAKTPSVTAAPKIQQTSGGLATAVLMPEGHTAGSHKLPVVVAIYGGPHHSEVIASRLSFADDQWLANQGFAVVIIDNSGTPGQSPEFERRVVNDLSEVVLADQVSALTELAALYPDLDLDRVGIHGWSFGGYLSALAVLNRPDVYKAAWAGAPVTDWRLYDTAYTERYLGDPNQQPEVYEANSLIPRAAKLERPLMLIHGLADDNVLAAHSLQLSGALLAAGKPHQFLPLAGVSHMTPQVEITKNLMLLMRDFFKTHLA